MYLLPAGYNWTPVQCFHSAFLYVWVSMDVHGTPLGFLIMTEIVPQININNIILPLQGRCCNVIVLSCHPVSTDHLLLSKPLYEPRVGVTATPTKYQWVGRCDVWRFQAIWNLYLIGICSLTSTIWAACQWSAWRARRCRRFDKSSLG